MAADSILLLSEIPLFPFDVGVEIGLCPFDEMQFLFGLDTDGWIELGLVSEFVVVVISEREHFIKEPVIAGVFFHFYDLNLYSI